MTDSGYEIYKRQENLTNLQRADPQTRRNAQQLHAHLSARGIKADHLKSMHPSILAHHAAAAGVGTPDQDTLAMVHSMLSASENQ